MLLRQVQRRRKPLARPMQPQPTRQRRTPECLRGLRRRHPSHAINNNNSRSSARSVCNASSRRSSTGRTVNRIEFESQPLNKTLPAGAGAAFVRQRPPGHAVQPRQRTPRNLLQTPPSNQERLRHHVFGRLPRRAPERVRSDRSSVSPIQAVKARTARPFVSHTYIMSTTDACVSTLRGPRMGQCA